MRAPEGMTALERHTSWVQIPQRRADNFGMRSRLTTLILAALLAGCGGSGGSSKPALSERGRDSVIARSSLPGAGAVGAALGQSDAAGRRAASLDSLAH
jgi:hypothetical protein